MPSSAAAPPPVVVTLPAGLVGLFPGCEPQVRVHAATVAEAIDGLDACWHGMRDRLCDSTPAIRRHIKVFVEGELATLRTPVAPGAEVLVMTAIAGG